jgi:5'(3')-deoxyribonucleotidase
MDKKRVYVDMDGVLADYHSRFKEMVLANPDIKYPQATYDFFRNLEQIPLAKKSMFWMKDIFDVWILTRPSFKNPLSYTEKRVWVEENLGIEWVERLILSPDKTLLKGDILIDDFLWVGFEGEQILFGSQEYPNWDVVQKRLREMI